MTNTKKVRTGASNRSIAGSVFEGLTDLGKQTVKTGVHSLVGFPRSQQSEPSGYDRNPALGGSLGTPERMGTRGYGRKKEKPRDIEIFSFAERREFMETGEQIRKLVVMIKQEVKKIETQNKTMITETAKIAVEQIPDKPGIYHIRFFEWLLNLLRDVRKKITDSASWLSVAQSKQKKGYWAMAKKKGTSFTLSGERTAATQSG